VCPEWGTASGGGAQRLGITHLGVGSWEEWGLVVKTLKAYILKVENVHGGIIATA